MEDIKYSIIVLLKFIFVNIVFLLFDTCTIVVKIYIPQCGIKKAVYSIPFSSILCLVSCGHLFF